MKSFNSAIKVSDKVYWVGAVDWGIRDFHGYSTHRGSTYNAYLVMGEKVTLIDAVKGPFRDELMGRICSIMDPKDISYVVSNHSEMDHTGCLPEIVRDIQPEKLFASVMGKRALNEHFGEKVVVTSVENGEELDIGGATLKFIETRMLHWPDSMLTFLLEDGVLFSQDAFGMHWSTSERFADELDPGILRRQASSYFANILLPYSKVIEKNLSVVNDIAEEIRIIAPDHGPIWREDPLWVVEQYALWAKKPATDKALVIYDTMWQATAKMALTVCEGIQAHGAKYRLLPLSTFHRSDVADQILDSSAFVVGTPTLNNNLFPTIADVLSYIKGLRPTGLVGATFGSYGWSGEGVVLAEEILRDMGVRIIGESVKAIYNPNSDDLKNCFALGEKIADELKKGLTGGN